jgi:hypothetical protein
LNALKERAREREIATQTCKILRIRLIHCVRREQINHYENCRKEASEFLAHATHPTHRQLQPEWRNPEMALGLGTSVMDKSMYEESIQTRLFKKK